MRTLLAAVLLLWLPLAYGPTVAGQGTAAAPAGDPEAGKAVWAVGNTSCRNCHGSDGQGAFGPALAGRKLSFEQFRDYVRNPSEKMPAYIESELTDREIADLVTYFASLPPVEKPAPWRVELPQGAARGQQLAVAEIGCGQCHGVTLETPRHGAAEVNGDWEWFKHMVYEHTTAQREQWSLLDPTIRATTPGPAGPPGRNRVRMGNYSRMRLPEPLLKEIWTWVTDLGHLVPLTGRITAGAADAGGTTYSVDVVNAGVRDKGLTAEDVTIALVVPAGVSVVRAAGTGYQGVRGDEKTKQTVAVWRVPRLSPTDRQTFTITLSRVVEDLRAAIRWAKPSVKADDEVTIALTRG